MTDLTLLLRHALKPGKAARSPMQRRLSEALRNAVLEGRLPAGSRLPGSRGLAQDLGIARNTVLHAYEQLSVEGYVRADRQGTVVCRLPSGHAAGRSASRLPPGPDTLGPATLSHRGAAIVPPAAWDLDQRALAPGVPALDRFPLAAWQRRVSQVSKSLRHTALGYRDPLGEPVLRAAIATYVAAARGVRCGPAQVVVTSGTQESLALCAHLFADAGDTAWIEHPGYAGARSALERGGLSLAGVPVDSDGMACDATLWQRRPPRIVYTTPSHQYPLGVVLSLSRRLALIEHARRAGAWIIEDDYDGEFRLRGDPLPAMQGLVPDAPVIYLGTFSKTLYPSLRLGFMVLPASIAQAARHALGALLCQGQVAEQEVLAAFLQEGDFTMHVRRMRRLYAERQQALRDAIGRHWPLPHALSGGDCGLHLALSLPGEADDRTVERHAHAAGLGVRALSGYSMPAAPSRNGLVIGYGNTSPRQIGLAIVKLAACVKAVPR
ncbi:PLP-dependent aminotransferase family protein [Schlegelella sp. S2-27]|uniref:PLP-dependent aminotransferase family protein n=1 Tax=Caldimonas mangrovi TaxID=2944811 RepID=A0ABT0YU94_9BURK|nr:PLP-dependent aminotransferase family protein [Caldimonas mangrovi]MCM5682327.1 PLP-dependent aminotransferase family protein [Caldimonas mangrovi]